MTIGYGQGLAYGGLSEAVPPFVEGVSVREQLIQSFVAALSASDSPATVTRSLTESLSTEELNAIVVMPAGEDIAPGSTQERLLKLRVICVVGSKDEGAIDQKADSLLSWVEYVVSSVDTLNGLANEVTMTDWEWQFETGEEDFVGAAGQVVIRYFTAGNVSTSAA